MSKVIIFDHVSKQYVLNRRPSRDLRELLTRFFSHRSGRELFLALQNVTFDVEAGEALGIIGPNGAGKSTILKILARIVKCTSGTVQVNGRLTPLIEVGAGFHPDLTGRDNVYLNGSILGLTRKEIAARFERIVEFAELAPFIDVPVKRYSVGMLMRLGFAVAAHLSPDILLVDEVLAVGDMAFQRKCLDAIRELRRAGTTILFVSHSMESVSSLCDRVLYLEHGQVVAAGSPDAIIAQYRRNVFEGSDRRAASPARPQAQPVEITGVAIEDDEGIHRRVFATGETIVIRGEFECREIIPDAIFYAAIHRADGSLCFGTNTFIESNRLYRIEGAGSFRINFRHVTLMPGSYLVTVRVGSRNLYRYFDSHDLAYGLVVDGSTPGWGISYMPHSWDVQQRAYSDCGDANTPVSPRPLLPATGTGRCAGTTRP